VQSKQRPHRQSCCTYTTTTTKCRHNETHNGTYQHTTPQTSLTTGSALSRLCWRQGTVQSKQRPHRQYRSTYTTTTTMCRHNETHNATYQHTTPQTSLTAGSTWSRLCWWQGTVQSKQRPHRQSRCTYTTTTTMCRHNETHNATYQHTTPQTSLTAGSALSRLCWW